MEKYILLFLLVFGLSFHGITQKKTDASQRNNKFTELKSKQNNKHKANIEKIATKQAKPTNATIKLDSTISHGYNKIVITYDTLTNKTTEIEYYNDWWTGLWEPESKEEYITNTDGYIIELIDYYWNGSAWESSNKYTASYNPSHQIAEVLVYYYDDFFSVWELYLKIEFTYNAGGEIVSEDEYLWDDFNTTWVDFLKTIYSYDTQGNLFLQKRDYWDDISNVWIPIDKTDYFYNTSFQLSSTLYSWWDDVSNLWESSEVRAYDYDANGFLSEEVLSSWWNNAWNFLSKYEFLNNSAGQVIEKTVYYYDGYLNVWEKADKYEYDYDSAGNTTSIISSIWDGTGWENWSRESTVYDVNTPFNELLVPYWYAEIYGNTYKISAVYYYYWNSSQWLLEDSVTFYYSSVLVSTPHYSKSLNYKIFPNPASDIVNIEADSDLSIIELLLYDALGREVISKSLSYPFYFSVSGLRKGMYFYTLRAKNESIQGKLIVK